jgi:S1-C subfamily serine protease
MSGGYDDPFDDEPFRPAPPPQDRVWLHPSELRAMSTPTRPSRRRTVGWLVLGSVVVLAAVALVGKATELSPRSSLGTDSARLTASTAIATTSTAVVTSVGVRASLQFSGSDEAHGVEVERCVPGGSACKAGLRAGDLIVRVAGEVVPDLTRLDQVMAHLEPGQKVTVVVWRNGATISFAAILGRAT